MSMKRLVTWIALLAVFTMAARFSLDSDTWWHLSAGKWMVENRAVVQADPFSYTRLGADWRYPGWLVEIPMYALYETFGAGALNLWTAAMVTLAFFFIWRTLSGGVFLKAFVLIVAAAASGIYWAARPYLVTFLLGAVFLWILEGWRASGEEDRQAERSPRKAGGRAWPGPSKRLLVLPALMIIWANCHGGFVVGFILVGIYGLAEVVGWTAARLGRGGTDERDERWRRATGLAVTGVLMALAVCLNPAGPEMLLYPLKTASIGALTQHIQEWLPPDFRSRQVLPFAALLLLTFGAAAASPRRLSLLDFLLAAVFGGMALQAARNVALFALVAPIVITRQAAPLAEALAGRFGSRAAEGETPPRLKRLNIILFLLMLAAALVKIASVLPEETNRAEIEASMPARAVEFIRAERPAGQLFNSYNWGGYLTWALPEYPVYIDGRSDLYDDELMGEWLGVAQASPGWQEVLERRGVRLALIEPGLPLAGRLAEAGWVRLYADETAAVWVR